MGTILQERKPVMLVLSRKPDQEFHFPQLGISVRVLQVQGQRVRVGIEAPAEIQVLRSEVLQPPSSAGHDHVNQLNAASLGLQLAQRMVATGRTHEAAEHLQDALDILRRLDREARETPAAASPAASPQRVLLVEDDANERALLMALLELEGFAVVPAVDGLDALQQLQVCTPDFVLLDMKMPRCNGWQTVRKIREHDAWRSIPLIAVSGSSPEQDGLEIGRGGVDAWIPKPVQPQLLIQRLRPGALQSVPA
jgi:carbon storage regulator CsrA